MKISFTPVKILPKTACVVTLPIICCSLSADTRNKDEHSPLCDEMEAIGNTNKCLVRKQQKKRKSRKPRKTREQISKKQRSKAKKIYTEIKKAIRNGQTLPSSEISKRTGIPFNQVVTIIYRDNPLDDVDVREKFDKVKDTSKFLKSAGEKEINLVKEMTKNASNYLVTDFDEIIEAEDDYIKSLAQSLMKSRWSDDAIEAFAMNFHRAPAFADMMITFKNKAGYSRRFANSKNVTEMFNIHEINPELTESLYQESDGNGNFRYSIYDIAKIVEINELAPELLEMAKENPHSPEINDIEGLPKFSHFA